MVLIINRVLIYSREDQRCDQQHPHAEEFLSGYHLQARYHSQTHRKLCGCQKDVFQGFLRGQIETEFLFTAASQLISPVLHVYSLATV